MKELLKWLVIQFIAAAGIYLLLFLLGETLSLLPWLVLVTVIVLMLYRKRNRNCGPWWWWEKAKRKLWDILPHTDGR